MAIDPIPAVKYSGTADKSMKLLRAFAQLTLSEINILRAEVTDIKVRIAALDAGDSTALEARTIDQLRAQMKLLIDAM